MSDLAFHPTKPLLATGSGGVNRNRQLVDEGKIRIWDLQTNQVYISCKHTTAPYPEGDFLGIIRVAFSPDGLFLATGGWDRVVNLWDAKTGMKLRVVTTHAKEITGITFGPGGRTKITGSHDGMVRIHNR